MKRFASLLVMMTAVVLLVGCGKKEEEKPGYIDQMLNAVNANELQEGMFYVKSGMSFYALPLESKNYADDDYIRLSRGNSNSKEGIVDGKYNRNVSFTWMDNAIPTLYKNDQLIYVSTTAVPEFSWERYKDCGYSIGISDLSLEASGKITAVQTANAVPTASFLEGLLSSGVDISQVFTIEAINGTTLNAAYFTDGGIITGMTKDVRANVDVYIGTQRYQVPALADTRYFRSFELYNTNRYSLSPDGYAVVEVPTYLKSGYYLINGIGFVKYLNVERGTDELSIDMTAPYFYDYEGRLLTYYEYMQKTGQETEAQKVEEPEQKISPDDYDDKFSFTIDSPKESMKVDVAYAYINEEADKEATMNGLFPKAYLVDEQGRKTAFYNDPDVSINDGKLHITAYAETPLPGQYFVLFENFQNITKSISLDVNSGNSTTFVHTGNEIGKINIYYQASKAPHDFVIEWESDDRAAKFVRIIAPDHTEYSSKTTPGNIMANDPGRFVLKVPYMLSGTYEFEITGDSLGRVWVNAEESVAITTDEPKPVEEETEAVEGETSETEEGETTAEGETVEGETVEGGEAETTEEETVPAETEAAK